MVQKGVRHHLCEAPSGPFRQMVPDPFFRSLAGLHTGDTRGMKNFLRALRFAWNYRITGLRNRYSRDCIGIPMVARRAPGTSFPLEQYFPAGGYIAPITVYLRFDPDDPTFSAGRVRVGLADARSAGVDSRPRRERRDVARTHQ